MSDIRLDCSELHNINLRTDNLPSSISIDGSYFIQDLKTILNDFEILQEESFKKKLILALASNSIIIQPLYSTTLNHNNPEDNAKRLFNQLNAIIKEMEK